MAGKSQGILGPIARRGSNHSAPPISNSVNTKHELQGTPLPIVLSFYWAIDLF
jgi:hypothetical protein